jgi:hypothetical protein
MILVQQVHSKQFIGVPMSDDKEIELWQDIHRLLLSIVCKIEEHKFPNRPTTSELRKAGKKAICVDVKKE